MKEKITRSFKIITSSASFTMNVKGKAILVQGGKGPEGSRGLRLPDFRTIGT
jgi:hypothetical protein